MCSKSTQKFGHCVDVDANVGYGIIYGGSGMFESSSTLHIHVEANWSLSMFTFLSCIHKLKKVIFVEVLK